MVFVGPSPESIESFGLKHTARELATKAGVPVVPGSQGLIQDQDEAIKEAERLGFPVSRPSMHLTNTIMLWMPTFAL